MRNSRTSIIIGILMVISTIAYTQDSIDY